MKIYLSRAADIVLKGLLAGALSGLVCFAQTSPSPGSKARSPQASSSQNQTAAESASSPQKVVMTVGDVKVTKAEMDFLIQNLNPQLRQAVAAHGRGALGQEYSLMLLLSQKAVSDHLDASPDVQREIALQRNQMLAQAEYRNLEGQVKVNPDEISTYYTAHKADFDEASVREFVVRKKPENGKPSDPGLSSQEARARLDSIRKAIVAGTDVTQVAKQYDVPNVVMVEPEPRTVRKGQLLPALDKVAFELKDNQFSDPVDTPQALVLLQVVSHQQPQLRDVSPEIENTLRQQRVQAVLDDMKAKASIWMDPDYFKSPSASQASSPAPTPQTPAHP
jgi:peptidyl-prolyl cis-trans isomerase C